MRGGEEGCRLEPEEGAAPPVLVSEPRKGHWGSKVSVHSCLHTLPVRTDSILVQQAAEHLTGERPEPHLHTWANMLTC